MKPPAGKTIGAYAIEGATLMTKLLDVSNAAEAIGVSSADAVQAELHKQQDLAETERGLRALVQMAETARIWVKVELTKQLLTKEQQP